MSIYIRRLHEGLLLDYAKHFPVTVVAGARQVGKSRLLSEVFGPDVAHVVFDPVQDIENARIDPDLFLSNRKAPLILDEIQYVPQLVPAIKRFVDRKRGPGLYFVTESQQWEVMKNLAESLAGRAVFLDLFGLSLREKATSTTGQSWLERWLDSPEAFVASQRQKAQGDRLSLTESVYELVWRGWYPEAQFLPQNLVPSYYRSYVTTYIERDVRLLADVGDLDQFTRFYRMAAALTAQEVNASQFGRDLGISPQTARRWLNVLSATFQWLEIPAFSGNTVKRVSRKPKGYFMDSGLACHMLQVSSPTSLGGYPNWGAIFESVVTMEIKKLMSIMPSPPSLYHWRSHSGAEVDLILERDACLYPIEIKAKSHPDSKDLRGIKSFREEYGHYKIAPSLIIAPSENFYPLTKQDYVLPWDCK